MTAASQIEPSSVATSTASPAVPNLGGEPVARERGRAWPAPQHLALAAVLALSALLNLDRLSQNGYANIFYSAGVKSMLRSWHNFLFVSFDSGGLVTVDKPPLALWVQAASAKLFGFSPLSLLLPEAIIGVLAVAALYWVMTRRFGAWAAVAGALTLAVFPSFVAVSRENGVDPLLILLLILACGAGLRACETGRWRTLVWCGVLVGLAFNTKTLAAYLVVPSIALAYLLCAPGSIPRRLGQLAVAGLAMLVVSFAWIALVELTPASKRPYVGSSTNNTELGLTFEYNGFGRVEGQAGGPGRTVVLPGAFVPAAHARAVDAAALAASSPRAQHHSTGAANAAPASGAAPGPAPTLTPIVSTGREKNPIPFGGPPRPFRLFGVGLGDQAGWMLPFALFGLLGVALLALLAFLGRGPAERREQPSPEEHEESEEPDARPARRDARLAAVVVLGGWFLVEAVVLSFSKGIVHPYYVSALAPGTGAMAGAGAVAFVDLARGSRRIWGLVPAVCAVLATVAAQVVLLHREHYMVWFVPVLLVGAAVGLCALLALRRLAAPAVTFTFLLLLVAPTAYSATTWLAPAEGTFPAAGPKHDAGAGAYGVNARDLRIDRALAGYVSTHSPGSRWALLTVASDTASPMMLFGLDAGALGGYSGTDPALDGPALARLVADGQARYVLLGGEYSLRGGNHATRAVLRACKELAPAVWHSPVPYPFGLVLFDCAGREHALTSAG
ncbi:MAG TPA: glycosyltransferase family 39 protein [Solirubrobacteraceae bacterium]|nr:glycosyltransferase family 39 protein [Solirubrobacteraceae bacterium]